MCGRFTLKTTAGQWLVWLQLQDCLDPFPELEPRYNIAPTQAVLAIYQEHTHASWKWALMRWGLIPFWAKPTMELPLMINARCETAAEKPSFREATKWRRCVVVADGYFEWKGQGRQKQPWWIHRPDQQPFLIAGLWDLNRTSTSQSVSSVAILTEPSRGLPSTIHDRMPLLIHRSSLSEWLHPAPLSPSWEQWIGQSRQRQEWQMTPVRRLVNQVSNQGPDLIEPFDEESE
jgi:putative SOS response-associated peptidase YedK